MPDHPRGPGHPADMPSSRSSESTSKGSSQNNTYIPPPVPPPLYPPGGYHTRNIIIGAIVTVLSSTVIYYLTVYTNRSKTNDLDKFEMKEATVNAWKSFVAYENTYTKNSLVYQQNIRQTGVDEFLSALNTESGKFQKDVEDLAKTKNIDRDLIKALNRRLENEKTTMTEVQKYYGNLEKIGKSNQPDSLKRAAIINELDRWNGYYKSLYQTAVNDISEIAKTLSERYLQQFSMNDFLVIQMMPQVIKSNDSLINVLKGINPEPDTAADNTTGMIDIKKIIGDWKDKADKLTLQEDHKMSYELSTGYKAKGGWTIENNELRLNEIGAAGKQKNTWYFKLSKIEMNSFTMTRDGPPFETYHFTRVN